MLALFFLHGITGYSQDHPVQKDTTHLPKKDSTVAKKETPKANAIKPYKEVIPDTAISQTGLFTVHKVEEKYFFELSDSIFNREIMVVTRFNKVPGGGRMYGGELVNQQTIRWERGPDKNVFLRLITLISVADSTNAIYRAVTNSNLNPLIAAFDIKAFGKDNKSIVIDVTDFFKGDNQLISLEPSRKRVLNLGGILPDRSYISSIHTYPVNTEIKTVKTFSASPPSPGMGMSAMPSVTLPAAADAGVITVELNSSFLLLPKEPMARRLFDPRVGFFADDYTVYSDTQQKVDPQTFVVRWRLEPKDEDRKRWEKGELVEPKKPIVYYIDPATPKQWRPYLIQGVNDWQKAFEKAGFKNAIIAKEWPENDTTMSVEDARFSVIRYFASDIENAYGPNVHDPRSGEILESHIGWYHNVMKLVHDWYMIQTAAVDPKARKMKFDDELMGQLIRFVSSHEVGHTLGLRHNMGSSSTVPVENLRNKQWVEANGHTPSIMDYARFNYVAQPEDNISEKGLFPRINDYDKWAIQWGYASSGAKDVEEDKKITNQWVVKNLGANPRLWFGGEGYNSDPRAQTEDLGDNAMKASGYGIKNLKRIIVNLPEWTKKDAGRYEDLQNMYEQLVGQFSRYMGHVLRNVGGVQETFKSEEQPGDVYEPTPKEKQKEAIAFFNEQLFTTPLWLLDKNIINKINNPVQSANLVASLQSRIVSSLLSGAKMNAIVTSSARFGESNTYTIQEMLADLHAGIWKELKGGQAIDYYRRGIQKTYIQSLINLINPNNPPEVSLTISGNRIQMNSTDVKNTDVVSIARAELETLQDEINNAISSQSDKMSKYHLQDLSQRIKKALNPKNE
jgi:hypothetical protein